MIPRMVGLRWDGDERGEGVADATRFVAGVFELVDAMRSPRWVAEEPGVHLLPHIERACRTLLLEVEDARLSADGSFDVHLFWMGEGWRVGEIRAAVFALVGSFAEIATYVRQRRVTTENRDETLLRDRHRHPRRRRQRVCPARAHGADQRVAGSVGRSSVGAQGTSERWPKPLSPLCDVQWPISCNPTHWVIARVQFLECKAHRCDLAIRRRAFSRQATREQWQAIVERSEFSFLEDTGRELTAP